MDACRNETVAAYLWCNTASTALSLVYLHVTMQKDRAMRSTNQVQRTQCHLRLTYLYMPGWLAIAKARHAGVLLRLADDALQEGGGF